MHVFVSKEVVHVLDVDVVLHALSDVASHVVDRAMFDASRFLFVRVRLCILWSRCRVGRFLFGGVCVHILWIRRAVLAAIGSLAILVGAFVGG